MITEKNPYLQALMLLFQPGVATTGGITQFHLRCFVQGSRQRRSSQAVGDGRRCYDEHPVERLMENSQI